MAPVLGIFRLVGPNHAVELLGIRLVGVNAENGLKLLVTFVFVLLIVALGWALRGLLRLLLHGHRHDRAEFWGRQGISLLLTVLLLLGIASIWFDDPTRLATAFGLVTAGLAFALQKVVTAVAGYFVILRGKTFNVGDRIVMGGVRGDVIALSITQTTIMEMGQPPPVQAAEPPMWVRSRQYTGRIVTVSNSKIFDEPVYNYSHDFPYIWEELSIPIPYDADRKRAEQILLAAAERHSVDIADLGARALAEMQRRYFLQPTEVTPQVYYRLTDNWLELAVRFIVEDRGIRAVKDAMSREVLAALESAGIPLASTTIDIVGLPPVQLRRGPPT